MTAGAVTRSGVRGWCNFRAASASGSRWAALVNDAEVLFLDDPTTSHDPQSRRQLWDLVEGFRRPGGTVLLTTHYTEEAGQLCDRVAIVDRGKRIAQGTPRELILLLGAEHVIEFTVEAERESQELAGPPGVSQAPRGGRPRAHST